MRVAHNELVALGSKVSGSRLKRARAAEAKVSDLKDEVIELSHADTKTAALHADAFTKIQGMPTWRPMSRGNGGGKGGKLLEPSHRETIYGMLAAQAPLSAINTCICTVVKVTAPWLEPAALTHTTLTTCRFELRTMEESMAAREVADAYAIRMLGSDETSKNQVAAITSNVIIEPTKGAALKPIILRGAYCSAGGTAEAVATAIEEKCFARLRRFLHGWREVFERKNPGEPWTGPDPEQISLARLAGGGALQGDTCNTAQRTKGILAEMIAEQMKQKIGTHKWSAMTEQERAAATRVHKLDCWQHMRNIFLKEQSAAQTRHVAEALKDHLADFSSWDRMTADFNQLLRASYKEFHQGGRYYKGKGIEFFDWLRTNYPNAYIMLFERAEGGRQDLDFDAAVPMYIMRPYIIEFLHSIVYGADHSNVLEDFLYTTYRAEEYIAMTRTNALFDLLVSRPLRWLSGNSYKLKNWSPLDMSRVLKRVEELYEKAAVDGKVLLDPAQNDVFKEFADEQPLFAKWRKFIYQEEKSRSPDGKTQYLKWKEAHNEVLNPQDPTNASAAVREMTIEYISVQCVAGLKKMHDEKLAIAKWLPDGDVDMVAHTDTIGLDATNDRLAESVFGTYDYVLRRCPGISMEAASAVPRPSRRRSAPKASRPVATSTRCRGRRRRRSSSSRASPSPRSARSMRRITRSRMPTRRPSARATRRSSSTRS